MNDQKDLLCLDSVSNFLGIFDLTIAPSFLYYSYIPIIFLMFILGFLVYRKEKNKIQNQLFFGFSLAYIFYLLNEMLLWVAIPVDLVFFGWQMIILLKLLFSLLFFMFAISFIEKKDFSNRQKLILLILSLPIFIFLPTQYNISYFEYEYCEGINSLLRFYTYFLDVYFLSVISYVGMRKFKATKDKSIVVFTVGSVLMLLVLMFVNIIGDETLLYEIDVIGPLGILIFTGFLSFMVVRYKAFNFKLIVSQVLVLILAFLTFAALFIRNIENVRLILIVNLITTLLVGYLLVRSVRKVHIQRELLAQANQNQESLLHFITHQIKAYMTKTRNIFDGMLQGDYGEVTPKIKEMAQYGFDSETRGVETVQAILKASDLKSGRTEFNTEKTNISALVAEVIEFRKDIADQKNIELTFDIEPNILIQADPVQLKEVFKNIVSNAIIYTQKGSVHIILKREGKKIRFAVIDTGFGLTQEDKTKLFQEGGKSMDSLSVNVESTGYGLYIAKQIVKKHGGSIGAKSEGRGKGSEFFVYLPDVQ